MISNRPIYPRVCVWQRHRVDFTVFGRIRITKIHWNNFVSKDKRVPYWNSKITQSNIFHEIRGTKNNGDLLDMQNVLSIVKQIGTHCIPMVTGDGGFDTTDDYNRQEELSYPLILSEVLIALKIQSLGGTFVCKLFDTFLPSTLQLMDILTRCYEKKSKLL